MLTTGRCMPNKTMHWRSNTCMSHDLGIVCIIGPRTVQRIPLSVRNALCLGTTTLQNKKHLSVRNIEALSIIEATWWLF